ncbi:MAG: glycosyltransferase family 2 protein [Desulfotomaculaceae bacterium]|nr:glycosyltransferase family 2 protein [Desulfotomaculaceae bacterium]
MKPLVSIITAAYNAEKTIAKTIQSVIRQNYANWEMILVDDGSTDDTVKLIRNLVKTDHRISLYQNGKNIGPARSRNLGLRAARGKYITFIDSDDLWLEHFLSSTISLMEKEQHPFVFSSYRRISEDGAEGFGDFIVPDQVSYAMLLKTNYIPCLTAVYNSEIIGKRYFNTSIPLFEDYLYWLTILKEGYVARGQKEVLALYRIRRGSVSRDKKGGYKHIWSIHKNIEQLPFYRRVYLIICYAVYGLRKNYQFIFLK